MRISVVSYQEVAMPKRCKGVDGGPYLATGRQRKGELGGA